VGVRCGEPPTINFILRVIKMSKKILDVVGSARRCCYQNACGSFHSAHKQEDIEKWLEHKGVGENTGDFMDVFADEWFFEKPEELCEDFEVDFEEEEDISEFSDECFYDKEIQEFLDEEPKRERDAGVQRITYQLKDMIGNIDGIKDTTIQLLNDFNKVVKTYDVEKMTEDEKKLYQTLNDMTQLTRKFPKPKVEKETYEPF
jgi:hypothetical protein